MEVASGSAAKATAKANCEPLGRTNFVNIRYRRQGYNVIMSSAAPGLEVKATKRARSMERYTWMERATMSFLLRVTSAMILDSWFKSHFQSRQLRAAALDGKSDTTMLLD